MDNKIITKKEEKKFLPSMPIKSISDVVIASKELKTLVSANKDNPEVINDFIELMIIDITTYYNENWNKIQKETFIESLMKLGYYTNSADLNLFKAKCLSGVYELKFRLTPHVLIEWFKEYLFERGEAFANENLKAKVQKENAFEYSSKTIDLLKTFADNVTTPKAEIKEPSRQDKAKQFVNQVHNDFKRNSENIGGVMFIDFNGKKLNFDEYLKARTK